MNLFSSGFKLRGSKHGNNNTNNMYNNGYNINPFSNFSGNYNELAYLFNSPTALLDIRTYLTMAIEQQNIPSTAPYFVTLNPNSLNETLITILRDVSDFTKAIERLQNQEMNLLVIHSSLIGILNSYTSSFPEYMLKGYNNIDYNYMIVELDYVFKIMYYITSNITLLPHTEALPFHLVSQVQTHIDVIIG